MIHAQHRNSRTWFFVIAVCVGIVSSAFAGPFVWIVTPDFGADFVAGLSTRLPESRVETSDDDVRRVLDRLREKEGLVRGPVLLLNCRPSPNVPMNQYAEDLRAVIAAAHDRGFEV